MSLEDNMRRDLRTIENFVAAKTGAARSAGTAPSSRSPSAHYFTADGQPAPSQGRSTPPQSSAVSPTDHSAELAHLLESRLTRPQRAALLQALRHGAVVQPVSEALRRTVLLSMEDVVLLGVVRQPPRTAATTPHRTKAEPRVVGPPPPLAKPPRPNTPPRASALRRRIDTAPPAARTASPSTVRVARTAPQGQGAPTGTRSPARAELTIATSATRRTASISPPRNAPSPLPSAAARGRGAAPPVPRVVSATTRTRTPTMAATAAAALRRHTITRRTTPQTTTIDL